MSHALPEIPRQNNIGLLRLGFALMVLVAHSITLSAAPALTVLQPFTNPDIAVQGFFVLSGFLVVMSYEHSTSLRDYVEKRFRRIYPAYACVILACAVLGYFLTPLVLREYFNAAWLRYVLANLTFLNFLAPELPGLFPGNPHSAINGPLWTIKIEVMFYAFVPLLVWLLRTRFRFFFLLALYLTSLVYTRYCAVHGLAELGRQLPGQLPFFLTGSALYYYFTYYMKWRWMMAASALLILCALPLTPMQPLYPIALGVIVITAAFGPFIGNAERYGDFSYGIYIWHFPIIQMLVLLGLFAQPWLGFAGTIALASLAALLSWHRVEKPALRRSSHYVTASES